KPLKKHLQSIGFDSIYGARPLQRIMNELLIDEIALQVIEGKIQPGDTVDADYKGIKVTISIKKPN
ncbi:hypothetical protein COY16_01990, partial [Candidatus Roizmanbacteria bacterium CG_4_10_14_0_2_um_filter_39_13]